MEETYPLAFALFDFVSVASFFIRHDFLSENFQIDVWSSLWPSSLSKFAASFLGGFFKAVWKLLFTIVVGNYQLLSESQFLLVASVFLVLLISVIMMARSD